MGQGHGTRVWDKCMGQIHGKRTWDKETGQGDETMGHWYGTRAWDYGIRLWDKDIGQGRAKDTGQGHWARACGKGMGQGHEVTGNSNILVHLLGRGLKTCVRP